MRPNARMFRAVFSRVCSSVCCEGECMSWVETGNWKKENCADIKKCVQKTGLLSSLQLLIITLTFDVSNSVLYMNLTFLVGQSHRLCLIWLQCKCQVPLCCRFCEIRRPKLDYEAQKVRIFKQEKNQHTAAWHVIIHHESQSDHRMSSFSSYGL